jgi:predicted transcriptional regulator
MREQIIMREQTSENENHMLTKKDKYKIIIMPIVIVLLTAFLGTFIGLYIQNRSFRKNELFKSKLASINEGKTDTVHLLQDVEAILRQIRSSRKNNSQSNVTSDLCNSEISDLVERLKKLNTRTELIKTYNSDEASNKESKVNTSIEKFKDALKNYLYCINGEEVKDDKGKILKSYKICEICNDEANLTMDSLREIIKSHVIMQNELQKEYDSNLLSPF